MTPDPRVALVLFGATYVLLSLRRIGRWRLDRPSVALLGGALMVLFGVVSPGEALAAQDLRTLGLLLGMMLVVASLELCGFFGWVSARLVSRAEDPRRMLVVVMGVTAVLSAVAVNDTVVLLFTPILVAACRVRGLDPVPFLVGEALAANIGSVATPVGNPQNAYIAVRSGIPFAHFSLRLLPLTVVSLAVAVVVVAWVFRRELRGGARPDRGEGRLQREGSGRAEKRPDRGGGRLQRPPGSRGWPTPPPQGWRSGVGEAGGFSVKPEGEGSGRAEEGAAGGPPREVVLDRGGLVFSLGVLALVFAGFLLEPWTGLPLAMVALIGGSVVLFGLPLLGRVQAPQLVGRVDWSILLFFAGLFVVLRGAGAAGIPGALVSLFGGLDHPASLVGVSAVLSNLISNVPAVILLADFGGFGESQWLALAASSTLAGNATILGAAANVIVVEGAAALGVEVSLWRFVKAGLPVALVTLLLALASGLQLQGGIGGFRFSQSSLTARRAAPIS